MKRLVMITIWTILPMLVLSQDIAITMSVDWKRGEDIFQPDSMVLYPELVVAYTNLSDDFKYFKKVSDKRLDYPITIRGTLLNYSNGQIPDKKTLAMNHGDYFKERLIVCVNDRHQNWENYWEVFSESTYEAAVIRGEEYEIDFVNDDLSQIHDYMIDKDLGLLELSVEERRNKLVKQENSLINQVFPTAINCQKMTDSIESFILDNMDRFVFLAPFAIVRDTFNLAAFEELGGDYLFELLTDSISPCLPVYDEGEGGFKDISMPNEINGYKLYVGQVLSNKVSLKLKTRRRVN